MMFGAVQLGAMAACVVLFVPMGMAGWHLSRNKMLFFSCALFIALAVGVHLTPYFPSISSFLPSPGSQPPSDSCISLLHRVAFEFRVLNDKPRNAERNSSGDDSWKWVESESVIQCGFQKLRKSDASDLLNGSWVVAAGDSQARLVVVSLLELLMEPKEMELIRGDLFKRHSDYTIVVEKIGMKLDFKWAPYVSNLTDFMLELKDKKSFPDVVVMGAGLWDMLHVNNAVDYGVSLKVLRDSLVMLLPVYRELVHNDEPGAVVVPARSPPHMFWLGMPVLINSVLNTDEKKEKMTDAVLQAYTDELYRSKLLREFGGPFFLLDTLALSSNCGAGCTDDGMHYDQVVYEALVHVMLNGLLIESNQKL